MAPVRSPPDPALHARTVPAPGGFGQETDNAAKYERAGTLERRLLARFRARLLAAVQPLAPRRVLDAGCGEGHVTAWLAAALPASEITGLEGRAEALAAFRERNPGLRAVEGDLCALPFLDRAFELVLCTEVLEHLPQPRGALHELGRVCSGHLLLTVPHEPFFRAGNLARGRYLTRLGSTPGHVSTWGRCAFLRLVETEAEPLRWISLFPWQGVLARPRGLLP
jgi:SAM-dependent methyltransferase